MSLKTKKIPAKRTKTISEKTFSEFFAGIGLVREGLVRTGWRCVYANDISAKKQQAYEARFGVDEHFHLHDITDANAVVTRMPGQPFLATASFPCVDLSLAGNYRGLAGKESSTFFGFIDVVKSLGSRQPQVIMVENVTGLLTSRGGEDFADAVRALSKLGYWLDAFVLDASHFTPQSRPRVFIIAVLSHLKPVEKARAGWLWPPQTLSPLRSAAIMRAKRDIELETGWVEFELPNPPSLQIQLKDVIAVGDDQAWWSEHEVLRHYAMMSDLHRGQVDKIVASKADWTGTIFRRIREGQMRAEVRFDGIAGCLRTPKGGSAKQIVISIRSGRMKMRWMSPAEYAALQGVPDFPLVGSEIQQLWGFADAVCVPAIEWIDQQVLTPLYEQGLKSIKPERKKSFA
ncbi:DNA cytosine methyltransferase [Limnoglobus roseus]|uniref:DNA (cytosine-5-)-methyltransferase n=1 Tax=Limnoglobus roseus TaxID=2598579 RepID=A0A5C1ANM8_9BACT|nr:DNA cytosine methyltransferase [Limnoglobus roseus]QEL19352.1 DNA cytosine methyltransferase [Limnoglobus roseus]